MTRIDDQRFFAWLDGELEPATAAEVAAAVETDPSLARRAADHRALRASLSGAFAPLMDASVPDRIGAAPVDFAAAARARSQRQASFGLPQWAAIAATLVLGVGLGTAVGQRDGGSPVAVENGRLVAAAGLERALDVQLASAQDGKDQRIGLTFRDSSGKLCRSFSGAAGSSGLACRADGEWEVRGLFGGSGRAGGEYRMAAGEDPALAALIEQSIAGEPLDAAGEAAAKERGWR